MQITGKTRSAIVVAVGCLALAACDAGQRDAGNAPTVGQRVDRAVAETRAELSQAGKQVEPALERAGAAIERGAQQVKPAFEKAGEQIREAANSDAAITASIKADYLKDPDLSAFKIDVDTQDGVVTLNGVAESAAARARAEKLAAANKGVREVRNHLTVKQG